MVVDSAVRTSAGLVSGLYRMAPSEVVYEPREAQRRVVRSLMRLVTKYGGEEVRRRLREALAPDELKNRLMLVALMVDEP